MRQYGKLPTPRPASRYDQIPWHGVEQEVGALLYGLVRMTKPKICVETGLLVGDSAEWIGRALRDNKEGGTLVTCDIDEARIGPGKERLRDLPVEVVLGKGQDVLASYPMMDFVHIDSGDPQCRENELMSLGEHNISPGGIVCWHDACLGCENLYGSFALARDWPHLVLPSIVGFSVFQRPE